MPKHIDGKAVEASTEAKAPAAYLRDEQALAAMSGDERALAPYLRIDSEANGAELAIVHSRDRVVLARYLRECASPSREVIAALKRAFDPSEDSKWRLDFARREAHRPKKDAAAGDAIRARISLELGCCRMWPSPETLLHIADALDRRGKSAWALIFSSRVRGRPRSDGAREIRENWRVLDIEHHDRQANADGSSTPMKEAAYRMGADWERSRWTSRKARTEARRRKVEIKFQASESASPPKTGILPQTAAKEADDA